jgi:hypothetical protein
MSTSYSELHSIRSVTAGRLTLRLLKDFVVEYLEQTTVNSCFQGQQAPTSGNGHISKVESLFIEVSVSRSAARKHYYIF